MLENFMLERRIKKAEKAMIDFLAEKDMKPESAYHYGAIEIDPKHLAIHLMYQTTEGMDKAYATEGLIEQCFSFLKEAGYPKGKEEGVHIGFESIQKFKKRLMGTGTTILNSAPNKQFHPTPTALIVLRFYANPKQSTPFQRLSWALRL